MSESRLLEIKKDIARMKDLYAENDYPQGDQILYSLQERHLDWLVQQVEKADEYHRALLGAKRIVEIAQEKANKYEETLKYIQFQLKNGGKGKRERISDAVDKALEGIT